jgi:hypothetical protein
MLNNQMVYDLIFVDMLWFWRKKTQRVLCYVFPAISGALEFWFRIAASSPGWVWKARRVLEMHRRRPKNLLGLDMQHPWHQQKTRNIL